MPTELLIFLQPNLMGWYIIISWSVLGKKWIVVFKVKVKVKAQNFISFLSIAYFLYRWSLGKVITNNQAKYNEVDTYWQ